MKRNVIPKSMITGTDIKKINECFVHWKQRVTERDYGLNFTTPHDATRFIHCCMVCRRRECKPNTHTPTHTTTHTPTHTYTYLLTHLLTLTHTPIHTLTHTY